MKVRFSESSIGQEYNGFGRILVKKHFGQIAFFKVRFDEQNVQLILQKNRLDNFRQLIQAPVGSCLHFSGQKCLSKSGEPSIDVAAMEIVGECLRFMPDKFHGLTQSHRYEDRILDLLTNEKVFNYFTLVSEIIQKIREFLWLREFREFNTGVLQEYFEAGLAYPFSTHCNANDKTYYLSLTSEVKLKRLIVAGYNKVFEILQSFRNEGIDASHLQEFTMLEFYIAYADYRDNILFTRQLMQSAIQQTMETLRVRFRSVDIDFSEEWQTVQFRDLLLKDTGIDILAVTDTDEMLSLIKKKGIEIDLAGNLSIGALVDRLYKKVSRPKIIQPTIVTGQPMSLMPLAKPNDDNPRIADAFQVIVHGWEIVKGYSELADPVIQRSLLEEQARYRAQGDEEAMFVDEDFLLALEYGMPPVSGVGIGLDRLLAIITDQYSLRDVTLFPMLR